MRQWLASVGTSLHFAEPFAGGANVGLTVAMENLADRVTLVELDRNVAAVWETVLNGRAQDLAQRIIDFRMSRRGVEAVLARRCNSSLSRAFATIVKNRARRGGIMTEQASLLRRGENDKGVRSRWYPETLRRRIQAISGHSDRITFLHRDGLKFIRSHSDDARFAFFIDPPYTVVGERLYEQSEVDHQKLFKAASAIKGTFLITCDNSPEIRLLVKEFGFEMRRVKMRTAHHSEKTELLIGADLSWFNPRTLSRHKGARRGS